jgi:hypothetical protein
VQHDTQLPSLLDEPAVTSVKTRPVRCGKTTPTALPTALSSRRARWSTYAATLALNDRTSSIVIASCGQTAL